MLISFGFAWCMNRKVYFLDMSQENYTEVEWQVFTLILNHLINYLNYY